MGACRQKSASGDPNKSDGSSLCGDGVRSPTEACDDGNTSDGDGCSAACASETRCGNNQKQAGEACDDGNIVSGDGCSADCNSNEQCGNGIVDFQVGEQCDDSNTVGGDACAANCDAVPSCGNGTVNSHEQCDDSNQNNWDGCQSNCTEDVTFGVGALSVSESTVGCDLNGDFLPDNQFSSAIGVARTLVNSQLTTQLSGDNEVVITLLGWNGGDDSNTLVGVLRGGEQATTAKYKVRPTSVSTSGVPTVSIGTSVFSDVFSGGPEDIVIENAFLADSNLVLNKGHIFGTILREMNEPSAVENGLLCGSIPLRSLNESSSLLSGFGAAPSDPCDGSSKDPSLGDILIGGLPLLGILGAQPDIDMDGDGLETIEINREGVPWCQPVVVACVDGDGTRIEGRDCLGDPRIADGFSVALDFDGPRVSLDGTLAP